MNALVRPTFLRGDKRDANLSLRRFALWWLNRRIISPPKNGIRHVGDFSGIVLYREPPFQVEMFIAKPRADAPPHTHPNVESIGMIICGDTDFGTEREDFVNGFIHINAGESHWINGKEGPVTFYSFQKWLDEIPPTSVDLDWIGKPISHEHGVELSNAV